MSRFKPQEFNQAPEKVQLIFNRLEKKMGKVINLFQLMGRSEAILEGFLALQDCVDKTCFNPQQKELISLFIAELNACGYCLAAHSTIAQGLGLKTEEIIEARFGRSLDFKTAALLGFVGKLILNHGQVSDEEIEAAKKAGVTEQEILELPLLISLNIFTNYFNHICDTDIDFPKVEKKENYLARKK